MFRYRRPLTRDLALLVGILLGWSLWWSVLRTPEAVISFNDQTKAAFFAWVTLCWLLTIYALYWFDFFKPFRNFKFIPDLLTFAVVIPIAGVFAKPVIAFATDIIIFRNREIFLGGVIPAAFAVIIEGFRRWIKSKSTVKSNIYLALTEGEKERFMEAVNDAGWDKYYRILTQEQFNGALTTGGHVDYIVISRIATKNFIMHQDILQAQMMGISILDYKSLLNQIRGHISIHDTDLWTFLAGSVRQNWLQLLYREMKFYIEPILATILLIILLPILLLVAIAIKLTSPGPILFRQNRMGYLGFHFDLLKFRSMRVDAESKGAQWASNNDNRVTPIGKILRKTRLDELPQLWNIIKGEMSFIGPRPERPEFYEIIGEQVPLFRMRLLVRPGITGWAQLLGGYAASIEESERKLEYDLYYMQYLSPRMDLIILGRTVLTLLKGDSGR